MLLPLLILFSLLLDPSRRFMSTHAASISFSFPSFTPASCGPGADLICMQNATAHDGYISITDETLAATNTTPQLLLEDNVGRVLYRRPVLVWPASFMTIFTVKISKDAGSKNSGDGIAFLMTEDMSMCPQNSVGGLLGLFNHTSLGNTTKQLAVELDTYENEFDPDDNHIGIDTATIISDATANLDNIGVRLAHGREVTVKIEYDGWRKNLEIFVAYSGDTLQSVLNHSITLSVMVPSLAYVGFSGSTGSSFESHRILSWSFTSIPLPNLFPVGGSTFGDKTKRILVIVLPVVGGVLIIAMLLFLGIRKVRRDRRKARMIDIESRSRIAANTPKMYRFKQLSRATHSFSNDNLLGKGGYGSVYKGNISEPPHTVAVKRLTATSQQGEREYFAEICAIGRLRHKNIVQLHGWCNDRKNLLLVYELMPMGSLDRYISNGPLDWPKRYKILIGLASALLYLHEECGGTVVHRDVKPNNVMLDSDYNAHLGDFGLARLVHNDTAVTTQVAGTLGYLAPECGYTGKSTPESDVFSYGIVVLEVVCGRRSLVGIDVDNLVDYVWGLHGNGDQLLQAVDPKLEGRFEEEEDMKRGLMVGLLCSHPSPSLRPTMRKVVQVLTNPNEPPLELPESRPVDFTVTSFSRTSTVVGLTRSTSSAQSVASLDNTVIGCGR